MRFLCLDTFIALPCSLLTVLPDSLFKRFFAAGLPAALESAPVEPLETNAISEAVSITVLAPEIQIAVGMFCLLFLFLSLLPLFNGEKQVTG